jgi:endonuclease/exonuclease/phosphatase family metal-dependent hydrolase
MSAPDHPLRVMTFNIRQWRALDGRNRWYRRRELVFEVVRRHTAHVLGAQETHHHQLDEMLDAFPHYGAVSHRRYGGPIGAYAPIFFDRRRLEPAQSGGFWLAPDPEGLPGLLRGQRAWDAAVARICTWAVFRDLTTSVRFVVFNSHFDQRGAEARRNSALLVAERLGSFAHLSRLFTVDLNANESSEPLEILTAAGMRDSFRVVRPDEAPASTYHRFRGHRSAVSRGTTGHGPAVEQLSSSRAAGDCSCCDYLGRQTRR